MTLIKALLLPLAVCVALLVPEYELWSLDEGWSGAPDHALAAFANSGSGESEAALGECTYLLCPLVAPDDDDDAEDN